MSVVRTFIAVESSEGVRSRAIALIERLRGAQAKVSWVEPENIHATLHFLGDVELTKTADICRVVAEATGDLAPFDVEVHGVGAFPNVERPRTIWLGIEEGREQLAHLHGKIQRALRTLGYKGEGRHFSPHLTIGRVRGPHNLHELGAEIAGRADAPGGVIEVDEVVIFASYLERGGARHEALGRAALGGREE
jgi:2'-5' RNA ligase